MARHTSISARLFLLVFGFSVAWFTLMTGGQMVFEYQAARQSVDGELQDLFAATSPGLDAALWSYDLALVKQSLEGIRAVRFVTAAVVTDEKGVVVDTWGTIPASKEYGSFDEVTNADHLLEPLYHRFVVNHIDGLGTARPAGTLLLAADFTVLAAVLADRFRLIVINYLACTLGLMVILAAGLSRTVNRPLRTITQAIEAYRFDRTGLVPRPDVTRAPDELDGLWKSFEELTLGLRESWLQQRIMSSILEEADVMALVCDAEGLVLSSNAQARSRLAGGLPGGRLDGLVYGDEGPALLPDAGDRLAAGLAWRGEVETRSDEGRLFWLSVALLPLEVPDEPRARWGVMVEDVSARRLTERYRRERDLAREAARAKSRFLANLSHEVRTPMNAVVGLTALALDQDLSPRARDYLSQLSRAGSALLAVINDLLDFSRLEEGKVTLEVTDVEPAELLGVIDSLGRFQAREKGIELVLTCEPGVPKVLRGDPLRLRQILTNLTSNALKFTSEGRVEVRVRPAAGGLIRFEVADTGIGIRSEDQDRLFESFTQVDASTTRKYGGTGLGLAICRQLVELMGGRIGVVSEPGRGSTFWFEVPLEASGRKRGPRDDLAGLRVLVAEDNKVNQLVAREILAKAGIEPVIVADGRQAVEAVAGASFDLVLMDLQMPVMDGLEAVRQIRQTLPGETLPVLAMTAHTFAEERATCLAAGMQDLVPKPVDPAQLYAALSRWRPAASRT